MCAYVCVFYMLYGQIGLLGSFFFLEVLNLHWSVTTILTSFYEHLSHYKKIPPPQQQQQQQDSATVYIANNSKAATLKYKSAEEAQFMKY